MSEARQGLNQRLENPRDNDGGFWIRRDTYPVGATTTRRRQAQSLVDTTDNKENIPPSPAVTVRRGIRTRKSPLPHWYPRTPLRDITVIVKALERRRKRVRAAALQRRSFNPEPPSTRSPIADEMNSSNRTAVSEALPYDVSDTSPSQAVSSSPSISLIQHPLDISSSNILSTPGHFPSPVSVLINPSSAGPKPTDFEKKLQGTIAEMERLVLENLKKTPKQPAKKATHTLMLMR